MPRPDSIRCSHRVPHVAVSHASPRLACLACCRAFFSPDRGLVPGRASGVVSKDLDGIITSWNRGAERIYGYTADEMVGKSFSVLIHPNHPDEASTILQRIRGGERIQHFETVRIRKGGALLPVSLSESPIHDDAGKVVGISSIARDISERRREEEHARTTSQHARNLIEASLDPLVSDSIRNLLPTKWRALLTVAPLLLACGVANVHAEEIKIGGTGTALATMQLMAQAYGKNQPEARITVVPSLGSGGGIKAMLSGAIQLAVSSRPLNEAEAKLGAVAIPYGSTPFVFATSTSNPVAALTTQELVDIYAGRTERWAGGQKIRLVLRPAGDSNSEMIKGISPAMREAKTTAEQRKGMPFALSDQDAADTIEKIPGALGPSTLAQILSERRQLKALRLNGVEPSAKTIAEGSYPLHTELLLVTGPNSPPSAQQFVAFVRSAAGQEILRQTGHWVK